MCKIRYNNLRESKKSDFVLIAKSDKRVMKNDDFTYSKKLKRFDACYYIIRAHWNEYKSGANLKIKFNKISKGVSVNLNGGKNRKDSQITIIGGADKI